MLKPPPTPPACNLFSPFMWQSRMATYCFMCMEVLNKSFWNKWIQVFYLPMVHAFKSHPPFLPLPFHKMQSYCCISCLCPSELALTALSILTNRFFFRLPDPQGIFPRCFPSWKGLKLTYSPLPTLLTVPWLQTQFSPIGRGIPLIGARCFRLLGSVPGTTPCNLPRFSVQS